MMDKHAAQVEPVKKIMKNRTMYFANLNFTTKDTKFTPDS